jgi:hypothetical protein
MWNLQEHIVAAAFIMFSPRGHRANPGYQSLNRTRAKVAQGWGIE